MFLLFVVNSYVVKGLELNCHHHKREGHTQLSENDPSVDYLKSINRPINRMNFLFFVFCLFENKLVVLGRDSTSNNYL